MRGRTSERARPDSTRRRGGVDSNTATPQAASRSALAGCTVHRPEGFDGAVEITVAGVSPRAFPIRVTEGLGVCLKRGGDHVVVAGGRRLTYPADAVCVRGPGSVWSSEMAAVGFLCVDVALSLVPPALRHPTFRFLTPRALPDLVDVVTRLSDREALARDEALAELLGALLPDARSSAAPSPAVRRARDALASRPGEKLRLDGLAAEVGLDKFTLLRQFRREVGTTPHRYQMLVRIERARVLLARGVRIAEAAIELGFADQAHFARWFKRVVGTTPRAYAAVHGPRTVLVTWTGAERVRAAPVAL